MPIQQHIGIGRELQDIILADLVLAIAFAFTLLHGATSASTFLPTLIYLFPITLFGVSLSFILHEMMHKFTAQRFGAIAAFRTSTIGLLITLVTSAFGFLIGIPGATYIFTNSFTKRENGIVSLAGPLTNFAIFIIFYAIGSVLIPHFSSQILSVLNVGTIGTRSYLVNMVDFTLFISILLAFFNMLPVMPLDGSKVLHWNNKVYIITMLIIFIMLASIVGLGSIFFLLVFMLVIALFFSFIYRGFAL